MKRREAKARGFRFPGFGWPQTGSGRGGSFGTPTATPEEASPETDQEANDVVSGGGLVGPDQDDGEPHDAARRQVG